jgi:hypothetical protein
MKGTKIAQDENIGFTFTDHLYDRPNEEECKF